MFADPVCLLGPRPPPPTSSKTHPGYDLCVCMGRVICNLANEAWGNVDCDRQSSRTNNLAPQVQAPLRRMMRRLGQAPESDLWAFSKGMNGWRSVYVQPSRTMDVTYLPGEHSVITTDKKAELAYRSGGLDVPPPEPCRKNPTFMIPEGCTCPMHTTILTSLFPPPGYFFSLPRPTFSFIFLPLYQSFAFTECRTPNTAWPTTSLHSYPLGRPEGAQVERRRSRWPLGGEIGESLE
ncbi:hypothetical protein MAPG_11412 [Magnaporthiopsis poae ATCC 64411]|uniref:Uncharacterized protein n=1 Tax=Magnaporthiopsis poae (strain ATCC 64411 / 73-15) TaxID=644358 RepID=A0A0C4EF74_MAGP6|nr:hypothetical protein MAPG_11412 [Magnaporthiopsis poae ATCC 64411]